MRSLPALAFVLTGLLSTTAIACQPLSDAYWEESPRRINSNFDNASFVVVADIVRIAKARVKAPDSDFQFDVERTTFRVHRAFKGALERGATFDIDTGRSSCGRSVRDPDRMPFIPGRKASPSAYPKRWLIYYTPPPAMPADGPQAPPFEITSSPLSRPASQAGYDIDVLTRFAAAWRSAGRGPSP